MVAAAQFPIQKCGLVAGNIWRLGLGVAFLLLVALPGFSADPSLKEGVLITVSTPINSDVFNRVRTSTERELNRTDRPIDTIVYDFNPGASPSHTEEYGVCRELARYLLKVTDTRSKITTLAFVHGEVTGHTVLPILACTEIVMSPVSQLGPVLRDPGHEPDRDELEFYRDVARRRRGGNIALVMKMLERDLEIVKTVQAGATKYVARGQNDGKPEVAAAQNGQVEIPRGQRKSYLAAEAYKYNLCGYLAEGLREVATAYHLKPSSLAADPLEGRDPSAERIVIRQPIDRAMGEWLPRLVTQATGRHANTIIIELEDCSGGDIQTAIDLYRFLRDLKDDKGEPHVLTIAYIPNNAPGAATFLALGCRDIVMASKGAEGKESILGDFESVSQQRSDDQLLRKDLGEIAAEHGYPPAVFQRMLDPKMTIYRVHSREGNKWDIISQEELERDENQQKPRWDRKSAAVFKAGDGTIFKLTGTEAKELGIARHLVDSRNGLLDIYGIKKIQDANLDFLYYVGEFFRKPVVGVFLIMIGIACLILELKMPGVGLPGIIAALCFVLYFWAQSHLSGQIIWLAVLLFVLGLILIGLEIFVLPGFGVAGISGIILVIAGLTLAALEKKPETTQEWWSLGRTMGGVGLGIVGAVTLAFVLAWYLPSIPYANRLVLRPPRDGSETYPDEEELVRGTDAQQPATAALLGAIGVAATSLRPAGIARFGDDFIDVVSEGSYVCAGGRIQVIEIEGNRVVVKEV